MLPLISLRNGATCWPKEMKIICIFLNNFGKQKQEESAAPIHYFVCFFLFFSPFLYFFTVLFLHSFTLSCYSFILLRYQSKSLSLSYPFSLYFLLPSFSPFSLSPSLLYSPSFPLSSHPSISLHPSLSFPLPPLILSSSYVTNQPYLSPQTFSILFIKPSLCLALRPSISTNISP